MSYLFGDSTPSKLEVNYIEFLRDAVEFSVQVLLADQRIATGRTHTRSLEHATVAEVERLQKLGPLVAKAFEGTPLGAADSATARCVASITRSANDLVRAEAIRMRDALDAEIAKRDAVALQEREGCVKALEAFAVKHDLPGMTVDVHLAVSGGVRYAGRARMKTGFGLDAVFDLEIPANGLFDRVVRVERVIERLDVQAPEVGGWLSKGVKQRTQHLEKHHIAELSLGASGGTIKLRVGADGTGPGFDILYAKEAPPVRLQRVGEQEGSADQPFDVDEEDAKKLVALKSKLQAAVGDLARHRRRLVEAWIDGEVMRTHAKPTLLVERLIANVAPVVQEISARSQSPNELVLRRMIGGDRREEIFLSKNELKAKLEPLQDTNRTLFEPLWTTPAKPSDASATGSVPHTQTIRYRPGTPAIGTPPLNGPGPMANVNTPAPVAAIGSGPVGGGAAKPAEATPPGGDSMLRRTLIGATVQSAMQSAVHHAVPPADPVSKTPIVVVDPTHVDPPRTESGRIEVARKDKDNGLKEAAGTITVPTIKTADGGSKN
jgi:hypothetical protein